jgi:hypothetical protein
MPHGSRTQNDIVFVSIRPAKTGIRASTSSADTKKSLAACRVTSHSSLNQFQIIVGLFRSGSFALSMLLIHHVQFKATMTLALLVRVRITGVFANKGPSPGKRGYRRSWFRYPSFRFQDKIRHVELQPRCQNAHHSVGTHLKTH